MPANGTLGVPHCAEVKGHAFRKQWKEARKPQNKRASSRAASSIDNDTNNNMTMYNNRLYYCMSLYIYIYIERERDAYIHIHKYIYIYIYSFVSVLGDLASA